MPCRVSPVSQCVLGLTCESHRVRCSVLGLTCESHRVRCNVLVCEYFPFVMECRPEAVRSADRVQSSLTAAGLNLMHRQLALSSALLSASLCSVLPMKRV